MTLRARQRNTIWGGDALFGSRDEQVEAIRRHGGECKIARDTCRNVDFSCRLSSRPWRQAGDRYSMHCELSVTIWARWGREKGTGINKQELCTRWHNNGSITKYNAIYFRIIFSGTFLTQLKYWISVWIPIWQNWQNIRSLALDHKNSFHRQQNFLHIPISLAWWWKRMCFPSGVSPS